MKMHYKKHVFFCVNQRTDGRKCCADAGSSALRDYAKAKVKSLEMQGVGGVRINAALCMDRCALGPVLVIYPEGVWYTYKTREDIDEIIAEHLQNDRIVTRLLLEH